MRTTDVRYRPSLCLALLAGLLMSGSVSAQIPIVRPAPIPQVSTTIQSISLPVGGVQTVTIRWTASFAPTHLVTSVEVYDGTSVTNPPSRTLANAGATSGTYTYTASLGSVYEERLQAFFGGGSALAGKQYF